MLRNTKTWLWGLAAIGVVLSAPLAANVRDGVEAWSRGDYASAVAQWQEPAAAGDPDAIFNLAQAYRLGRGVPSDLGRAEALYGQAAQAGHVQAADIYGLILFQDGRHQQALPYVQSAARRGDPRAQYLLGIAHFNGSLVERDLRRAYALLTLANAQGLPQAATSIAQMDEFISLEERQQAAELAQQMRADADSARAVELAQADLRMGQSVSETIAAPVPTAAHASPRVPRPIPTVAVSPSVAAARDAVAQARSATGLEDPASAGASYASAGQNASRPARVSVSPPAARSAANADAASLTSGPWRVQLGAFSIRENAERLWARLSSRSEIAGRERLLIPAGRVTKLQAGGYASQSEAQTACNALKSAGQECIVTRN